MRTHPHLIKQTIDPRLINEINKRTQSNSEKLSNSDKLTYINDNYCEITRNYVILWYEHAEHRSFLTYRYFMFCLCFILYI